MKLDKIGDINAWHNRKEVSYDEIKSVTGWVIQDEINETMQRGYYLHAKTKKNIFGLSLSETALKNMLAAIADEEKRLAAIAEKKKDVQRMGFK